MSLVSGFCFYYCVVILLFLFYYLLTKVNFFFNFLKVRENRHSVFSLNALPLSYFPNIFIPLVGKAGFEPTAFCLWCKRSNYYHYYWLFCSERGIRTPDSEFMRLSGWPLPYLARFLSSEYQDRTGDLRVMIPTLYRLS